MGLFSKRFYLFSSSLSGAALIARRLLWNQGAFGGKQRSEKHLRREGQLLLGFVVNEEQGGSRAAMYYLLQSVCVSVFLSLWLRLGNWLAAGVPEVSCSQIGIHMGKAAAADCVSPALSHSHQLQISLPLIYGAGQHQAPQKKEEEEKKR